MAFRLFKRKQDKRPSMRVRLIRALGSIAAVLLLSGIISILEYRRMSDYVSELIASNIKSINLSQRLSDITQEYDQQMLAVVVTNDISHMPEFDLAHFTDQADSLKASVKSPMGMEMVDCGIRLSLSRNNRNPSHYFFFFLLVQCSRQFRAPLP